MGCSRHRLALASPSDGRVRRPGHGRSSALEQAGAGRTLRLKLLDFEVGDVLRVEGFGQLRRVGPVGVFLVPGIHLVGVDDVDLLDLLPQNGARPRATAPDPEWESRRATPGTPLVMTTTRLPFSSGPAPGSEARTAERSTGTGEGRTRSGSGGRSRRSGTPAARRRDGGLSAVASVQVTEGSS